VDVDETLRARGLSGARLLGIARDVANDAARRSPYCSEATRQALTSYLTEVALRETLRYDATRSGEGYSFPSYVWDILNLRVSDFYRRKSEGFGDKRSGSANRVTLSADPLADLHDGAGVWDEHDGGLDTAIEELASSVSPESKDTIERIVVLIACGYREPEIAKVLGVRQGEVRDRMTRLRAELRGGGPRTPAGGAGSPLAHASDRFRKTGVPR
jgi:DNA-directed RNA polymerase specialized sigma24 family protein